MAFINKQDTNGTKPALLKGELGYDDYTAGGDVGRVYVGDGTTNIPLALKSDGVVDDSETSLVDTWSSSKIDGELDTKLALAGGTMTGAITSLKETRVAMGANDIDLSLGNVFTKTISGATTLTVSNVPSTGQAISFILELTNGGVGAITWWSGVKWAGGTAPTLTTSGVDILGFYSHDGGTTWRGLVLAKDSK
jgi:hypothetical protein